MPTFLLYILNLFDRRRNAVTQVMKRFKQGTLSAEPVDLRLMQEALSLCTHTRHTHVFGKRFPMIMRVRTVDDFILTLLEINHEMQTTTLPAYTYLEAQEFDTTLYDFLVTNRGFVVSIEKAIERTKEPIEWFLTDMDRLSLESPEIEDRLYHHSLLMRQHVFHVLLAFIKASDQGDPQ